MGNGRVKLEHVYSECVSGAKVFIALAMVVDLLYVSLIYISLVAGDRSIAEQTSRRPYFYVLGFSTIASSPLQIIIIYIIVSNTLK